MAYQPKSSRKFITGVASAALVASAVAPVASSAASHGAIVKVYQAASVTAYKGQSTKDAKIQKTVKVKYKDGKTAWVSVKWENVNFTKAGTKRVYGTVSGTKTKAKVDVNVKVDSVAYVNNQQNVKVDQGITKAELLAKLPAKVKVKLASGKTQLNEATYDLSKVDFDKAGDYKVTVHAAHAPAKLDRVITVTLNSVDPAVTSVSAINAKLLEVKFSKEVSKSDAENINNYSFVGLPSGTKVTPELQSDNKTVLLDLDTAIPNDTTFVVTVAEIATKADSEVKTPKYTQTLTFSDTVAPKFVNVTYPRSGVAVLNFSEALSTDGTVKIYEGTAESTDVSKATFTPGDDSITLTGLKPNVEYHVVVVGAKDQSSNLITNPVDITVKNTISDVVAPQISSVTTSGLNTVKVQFTEGIDTISTGKYANVKIGGASVTGETQSFDTTTNTLTITKSGLVAADGVYGVEISGYKDYAGNAGATFSKAYTFSNSAPAVQKTEVIKKGNDTFVAVTFDKAPDETKIKDAGYKVSYLTPDNILKSADIKASDISVDTSDAKAPKALFKVTGFDAGSYTLVLPAANVTDGTTQSANDVTVKFTLGTTADTSVPSIQNVFVPGNDASSVGGEKSVPLNTVYVKYSKTMSASALNTVNYKVDGVSVFDKAVFVGDKTLVKLTLKDGALTLSGDRNFSIASSVTGENNVAIKPYTQAVTLNENVKPSLVSAKLLDGKNIELTFSEAIKDSTVTGSDYTVSVDGGTTSLDGTTPFNTGTTANDNKLVLTLGKELSVDQFSKTITVKLSGTSATTDLVGNVVVGGNTVTVSK
ncbi:Ig-like domain-containing protein [Margalitia sp. FSL K6-0131]|uniref:Ig-like domain-containing protein n=1 Tax=Margalitia sp. FSL K6-0131 TaxID=2954604 RepID=UPI0030F8A757